MASFSPGRRVLYTAIAVVLASVASIAIAELVVRVAAPQPASWLDAGGALHWVGTGVPGYGPVQYRQILEWELGERREPPKLLLVATYLGNDFHDCVRNRDLPVHDGVVSDRGDLKSAIKRRSHLYRAIARAYHVAVTRHDESAD